MITDAEREEVRAEVFANLQRGVRKDLDQATRDIVNLSKSVFNAVGDAQEARAGTQANRHNLQALERRLEDRIARLERPWWRRLFSR